MLDEFRLNVEKSLSQDPFLLEESYEYFESRYMDSFFGLFLLKSLNDNQDIANFIILAFKHWFFHQWSFIPLEIKKEVITGIFLCFSINNNIDIGLFNVLITAAVIFDEDETIWQTVAQAIFDVIVDIVDLNVQSSMFVFIRKAYKDKIPQIEAEQLYQMILPTLKKHFQLEICVPALKLWHKLFLSLNMTTDSFSFVFDRLEEIFLETDSQLVLGYSISLMHSLIMNTNYRETLMFRRPGFVEILLLLLEKYISNDYLTWGILRCLYSFVDLIPHTIPIFNLILQSAQISESELKDFVENPNCFYSEVYSWSNQSRCHPRVLSYFVIDDLILSSDDGLEFFLSLQPTELTIRILSTCKNLHFKENVRIWIAKALQQEIATALDLSTRLFFIRHIWKIFNEEEKLMFNDLIIAAFESDNIVPGICACKLITSTAKELKQANESFVSYLISFIMRCPTVYPFKALHAIVSHNPQIAEAYQSIILPIEIEALEISLDNDNDSNVSLIDSHLSVIEQFVGICQMEEIIPHLIDICEKFIDDEMAISTAISSFFTKLIQIYPETGDTIVGMLVKYGEYISIYFLDFVKVFLIFLSKKVSTNFTSVFMEIAISLCEEFPLESGDLVTWVTLAEPSFDTSFFLDMINDDDSPLCVLTKAEIVAANILVGREVQDISCVIDAINAKYFTRMFDKKLFLLLLQNNLPNQEDLISLIQNELSMQASMIRAEWKGHLEDLDLPRAITDLKDYSFSSPLDS